MTPRGEENKTFQEKIKNKVDLQNVNVLKVNSSLFLVNFEGFGLSSFSFKVQSYK